MTDKGVVLGHQILLLDENGDTIDVYRGPGRLRFWTNDWNTALEHSGRLTASLAEMPLFRYQNNDHRAALKRVAGVEIVSEYEAVQ